MSRTMEQVPPDEEGVPFAVWQERMNRMAVDAAKRKPRVAEVPAWALSKQEREHAGIAEPAKQGKARGRLFDERKQA